jgi:hypothetical protein
MRILSVSAALVLASTSASAQSASTASSGAKLTNLEWLSGCWVVGGASNPNRIEEIWTSPDERIMLSMTRYFNAGRAASWEYGRIEATDSGVVLVAAAAGQGEGQYRLITQAADSIVFENPKESPQRFVYRRASESTFSVHVMEGEVRLGLELTRTSCPGPAR